MELAFASLHQLCAPMLDRLERLPGPQRDALRIVFGLTDGTGARPVPRRAGRAQPRLRDGRAASAAVRRRRRAVAGPDLCTDARVRGPPSARRTGRPRVRVARSRRRAAAPPGARGARPRERRRAGAAELGGPLPLDEPVRDQILAETRGNPLALLELPRGLTPTQLAGGFGMPARHDLSAADRGELHPAARAPARGRATAAARRGGGAGRRSPAPAAARASASGSRPPRSTRRTGCSRSRSASIFRHPLARSAVYRSADAPERRAAHAALAEVTDRDRDPDRRVWHLASAAAGPDEGVAHELERSAGRAQARGGMAAAAAFLGRAVALTGDPARRAERALAAAQARLGAGAFDVARRLLDDRGGRAARRARATPAWICSGPRSRSPRAAAATRRSCCSGAAKKLEPLDVRLARDTYLDAWCAALFAGAAGARRRPARCLPRRGDRARRRRGRRSPCDLLLDGFSLVFTAGRAAATPVLRRAIGAFAGRRGLRRGDAPLGLARDAGGELPVGPRQRHRDRHARGAARPRRRARSRRSPSQTTRAARPRRSAATSPPPRGSTPRSRPSRRRPARASHRTPRWRSRASAAGRRRRSR